MDSNEVHNPISVPQQKSLCSMSQPITLLAIMRPEVSGPFHHESMWIDSMKAFIAAVKPSALSSGLVCGW